MAGASAGWLTDLPQAVLQARYLAPGETDRDAVIERVAKALAEAEETAERGRWAQRFARAMREGFIPGGRILAAAGRPGTATWVNCFVLPMVEQAGQNRRPRLTQCPRTLQDTVTTLQAGGGVGLDFSVLDDPVAALQALDEACAQATDASVRPGALMGVLAVDHPCIRAFIDVKRSNERPNERPNEWPNERPNERPHKRPNKRPHDTSPPADPTPPRRATPT